MVAMEQSNLAALELADGHPERARPLLVDALSALRSIPNGYLLPYALINTGGLMLAEDKALAAARLLAAAQAMFERDGAEIDPADRPVFDGHTLARRAQRSTQTLSGRRGRQATSSTRRRHWRKDWPPRWGDTAESVRPTTDCDDRPEGTRRSTRFAPGTCLQATSRGAQ